MEERQRAERLDHLGFEAGLLEHLARGGLLSALTLLDLPLGEIQVAQLGAVQDDLTVEQHDPAGLLPHFSGLWHVPVPLASPSLAKRLGLQA